MTSGPRLVCDSCTHVFLLTLDNIQQWPITYNDNGTKDIMVCRPANTGQSSSVQQCERTSVFCPGEQAGTNSSPPVQRAAAV